MTSKKRLFLIDAFALIFRGYYAFIKNPRINSKGMNTSAIMGFTNSLLDLINREKPEYLAVCFDEGGSVDRTAVFPEYKMNRHETPEAISIAVPYIKNILNAMHIPVISKPGYEADDIIGTLAKEAEKNNFTTYMVTPDKDFAQLVSENIFILRPVSGGGYDQWGVDEVKAKFEVENPLQVIDYLGMMGDAVDNIPGLPGVGDKTAKKFIASYGSMENLLKNTHELKGKLKEKVESHAGQGVLSKQLATILLDVPVAFNENSLQTEKPNFEEIEKIFQELEFRRTLQNFRKIFNTSESTPNSQQSNLIKSQSTPTAGSGQYSLFDNLDNNTPQPITNKRNTVKNTPHFYQAIDNPFAFSLFLDKLMQQKSVCFDTETTHIDPLQAELVGIAFSWATGQGYYIPIPSSKLEATSILEKLVPFFNSLEIEKIGQNIKYDIKVLQNYNIAVKGPLFDTMLAHYLINPDMRHNMDVLAETYLNYTPIKIETLLGKKGKNQKSMKDVSLNEIIPYAAEDADITYQLKSHFEKEITTTHLSSLFQDIEIPLVHVLAEMENEGINLDVFFLNELSTQITSEISTLETDIYKQAGKEFNIASPKQLGLVLFEDMQLMSKPKKTKTGQYATSEDILSNLASEHEIVANILKFRGLSKLKNTYIDALPTQILEKTGRVHTSYLQTVASTGRLASNNPNLQNIPIRTPQGKAIRKAFVPKNEDYVLLAADYSQIELRIIAALSDETHMINAFMEGKDIHADTASKVFNVSLNEVTKEQRSHAKTVNFGIIYGVSAFGLSNQTDLSRPEAKALIESYYSTYPKLRAYIQKQVDFARDHGFVQTILGRRRYLKDINSRNAIVRGAAERNAVNAPIQGSAADIIKIAMIDIHEKLKQNNLVSKMLLQVHDELVFDVKKEELETVQKLVVDSMQNAYKLTVPLVVDVGLGKNWLEAH